VWTYRYDAENRLTGMTTLLSAGLGFQRWTLAFKYDYLGRRVEKAVVNLDDGSKSYTRRYLYNGWNLVAELSGDGATLQRSYTWGLDLAGSFGATGGVGALLQITDHTASKNYFATYDHNGNVAALVRDDGTLAAAYDGAWEGGEGQPARVARRALPGWHRYGGRARQYSPFGEPLRAEVFDSDIADNPFRFSTKFTDTESGLVYYGYRYYSPSLGRFINRDPSEESGGINLYGFVGNDPVGRVDLLGLRWLVVSRGTYGGNGWEVYQEMVWQDDPIVLPKMIVHPKDWGLAAIDAYNQDQAMAANNAAIAASYASFNPASVRFNLPGPGANTDADKGAEDAHRRSKCQEYLAGLQQAVKQQAAANNRADQLNGYRNRLSDSFNNGQDLTFARSVGGALTDIADVAIGAALSVGPTKILAELALRTSGIVQTSRDGDVVGAIAGGTLSLTSITLEYGEIAAVGEGLAARASGFGAIGALGISLYKNIAPYVDQSYQERSIINGIVNDIGNAAGQSEVWSQSESYYRDLYNKNHCSDFF
jgi:RHS repeat-associated protein